MLSLICKLKKYQGQSSKGTTCLFALYQMFLGIYYHSLWFSTLFLGYLLIAMMKILWDQKDKVKEKIFKIEGILIFLLGCVLLLVSYLSIIYDVGKRYPQIVMITIATYTFIKIGTIVYENIVKKDDFMIRVIHTVELAMPILSLENSMLATFSSDLSKLYVLKMMTSISVCFFLFYLSCRMIRT